MSRTAFCLTAMVLVVLIAIVICRRVRQISVAMNSPHLPPGAVLTPTRACPSGFCEKWTFWRLGSDCYVTMRDRTVPRTCEGDR